ncbi:MAG: hypothetical protein J6A05_10365 [Oscillospiraceae bacterium]|nr:hypothetical protein [Oscillospiraceae bacterium]
MTKYEKMHNGMIYDCLTDELGNVQKHSHRLCEQYNKLGVDDGEEKQKLLHELFEIMFTIQEEIYFIRCKTFVNYLTARVIDDKSGVASGLINHSFECKESSHIFLYF